MHDHPIPVRLGTLLDILNQVHDVEKKLSRIDQPTSFARNVKRMREAFEAEIADVSLTYSSPLGESYDETRTDCEASIGGTSTDGLVITEVIKPMVHLSQNGVPTLIQKAVVIAEAPSSETTAPGAEEAGDPEPSDTDQPSALETADTTTLDTPDA